MRDIDYARNIVLWVLQNEIEARDDDDLLCALVDARLNPEILNVPYAEVRKNPGKYGLLPAETITRSRRFLQEKYPELKGCDRAERRRRRREKMFREYFRENKDEK